jgi:hypothetical protein
MNRRVLLLTGFLFVVWLTTLWGLWGQQNQLAGLRSDQQQLLAQVAANSSESPDTAEAGGAGSGTPPTTSTVTPELLRLRSEVTRLTERRRELAGARAENERLRAQFSSRGTNGAAGFVTPPGYIRKSEARMVGYNTPDDTLQSLLWAVQNHDLTNLLQAFTPEMAAEINAGITKSDKSIGDFFRDGAGFVGMSVVGRTEDHTSAGSIYVEVEVFPGVPHQQIRFRQTDGQWKIAGPF